MLAYIKGILASVSQDSIVVETRDIGYNMLIPTSVINDLPPISEPVKIYTYLHVREDAMVLFGFLTEEDKATFKQLITVSGIGPKGALGVLSAMSTYELKVAIMNNDVKGICTAPGIGKKTAQKLILELKDKLKIDDYTEMMNEDIASGNTSGTKGVIEEAVEALVSLGYSSHESYRAVKDCKDMTRVEDAIKAGLKKLAIF